MATRKRIIKTVEPDPQRDNTSRIALGISVIALVLSLFALLGEKDRPLTRLQGVDINQRVNDLEARSALTKAQAELLILTQRIEADPNVNVKAELDEIKSDLEEFKNDPKREAKEEWDELIAELSSLSQSTDTPSIRDKINLLILRIQQEIKND